jgi:hypothetical protein
MQAEQDIRERWVRLIFTVQSIKKRVIHTIIKHDIIFVLLRFFVSK